jgi:hypothetical protein
VSKSKCSFEAVVKIRGINPYIIVTKSHAALLKPGWRKPLPILVRIDGQPRLAHRVNLMPVGDGSFYLYLNEVIRTAAGAAVGDSVRAEVNVDESYRNGPQHPMPKWFRDALKKKPRARANWDALTPSRKKEVLRYLVRLKSDAARDRNLARMMHALSGAATRFMARDWKKKGT